MPTLQFRRLLPACIAFAFAASATAAGMAPVVEQRLDSASQSAMMLPPLENWAAPQFFNAPVGAISSDGSFGIKADGMTKAARTLGTFIPILPCRLVDTRGLHSPVFAGGPFTNGEVRVYQAAGNCGIPAGSNRLLGVSIAVTTLPTTTSGDIEVIANGLTLGSTALMTMQLGLWNSATTVTGVDANGNFQVQVRYLQPTNTQLAIDVNGYYAQMDPANTTDFFSILGNFNTDGGLLNVDETGSIGAAIRAVGGGGTDVRLAQGANAIDVAQGGLRVRGAGVNSDTLAFIHQTSAANICTDAHFTRIENPQTFSAAAANLSSLLLFAQRRGGTTAKPVSVVYQTGTTCAGGSAAGNGWFLFNDAAVFASGETYNIMVITP
jgi:hypothetical protein